MSSSSPKRVVVMTGATSALGAIAVKAIAVQPGTWVIIGARGRGRTAPEGTEIIPLDLASLASVRPFAEAVKQRLGDDRIDMLVLNAGAQFRNGSQQSAD